MPGTKKSWNVLLSILAAIPCSAAAFALCIAATSAQAAAAGVVAPRSVVYKTADTVKIEADVYRPKDRVLRPVVVWIHGGALMMGSRTSVPRNLREFCEREGYAIVSIDYRLAPEVKVKDVIEDVQDAFRWLRGEGAKQFHLDPLRVAVVGGSAGGYLTMMTGFCVVPRPLALVAYYGYGDIDGPWLTKPSEHYRKTAPLIAEADARKVVGEGVLTASGGPGSKDRRGFYLYCRQNGLWPKEVTGFDPAADHDKFTPFCPIRNLSPNYPPILMIHGTADTDVPADESIQMAKALAERNLPHELILIPNAGHGLGGGDPKLVEKAHDRAFDFLKTHLKG